MDKASSGSSPVSTPSFALISVLALISLAALTATAFLASARLERQATMPLTQATQLEMALSAGVNAAREMVDYAPSKHFNFITTYWRGTNAGDWTNELGYLLSGAVQSTSTKTSTVYNFYACFSTATMTNLGTNASDLINISNTVINQGTFTDQMAAFMQGMTNFPRNNFSGQLECTNIPLLGGQTSPPVGWVYITQNKPIAGVTNSNLAVARFAFFVQDTCGLIDAERMGGLTNGISFRENTNFPNTYTPGTNPAEIFLAALTNTALSNSSVLAPFVAATNRVRYLTPGSLVLTNLGRLNSNDLRYFTTGLRHWTNSWERIPIGLGYRDSWTNKFSLANFDSNSLVRIVGVIQSNVPGFTNRSGRMNGTNYLYALAANMIDYADADASATSTNLNGKNILGFDNYLFLTHLCDQFTYITNGSPPNTTNITITSYIQLWNPSTLPVSYPPTGGQCTLAYDLKDTVKYTNTGNQAVAQRLTNAVMTLNFTLTPNTNIPPNGGFIGSATTVINLNTLPGFPSPAPNSLLMNQQAAAANPLPCANAFTLTFNFNNTAYSPARPFIRQTATLPAGTPTNVTGFLNGGAIYNNGPAIHVPLHDPRMAPYWGIETPTNYFSLAYNNIYWRSYPTYITTTNVAGVTTTNTYLGDPSIWPDGKNTNTGNALPAATGLLLPSPNLPPVGVFTNPNNDPAPCKLLSSSNSYSNITELGNIFDPMQWAPPNQTNNYAECNITSSWTPNDAYGGGTTLRIGRPEHSRFAFTNLPGSTVSTPNMEQSAAVLLDLFCIADSHDESGQINLNTAPAPVLRALAGGVLLTKDSSLVASAGTTPAYANPAGMAEAFAQGVMRFRNRYPFYSPSQLCFIGTDPGWPNTSTWPINAVFGNRGSIFLQANAPGNSFGGSISNQVRAWSDEAAEEWFSKTYQLSTTYSRNFRVYVVAQLVNSNRVGIGPVVRKYYNVCTRQNTDAQFTNPPASASTFDLYSAPY